MGEKPPRLHLALSISEAEVLERLLAGRALNLPQHAVRDRLLEVVRAWDRQGDYTTPAAHFDGKISSALLTDEAFDLDNPQVRTLLNRWAAAEERAQGMRAELEQMHADFSGSVYRHVRERLRRLLEKRDG